MVEVVYKEIYGFQMEVKQLFYLMIYFLYLNKEIFFCELVLNVVDVVDKFCFCVLEDGSFYENDGDFVVKISVDKEVSMVIIVDNGIGMI